MSHITNKVVHSLSAFIVWRRVVDNHSDLGLTTLTIMPWRAHILSYLTVAITADDFRLQSSREISGPEVPVGKLIAINCKKKLQ